MKNFNPLFDVFNRISYCCDKIEEVNYNIYKLFSPAAIADIEHCVITSLENDFKKFADD